MNASSVPERHLTNVGRVVVAATDLEMMGAWILYVASGKESKFGEAPWLETAAKPGRVIKQLNALAQSRPESELLATFIIDYTELQNRRHRFVHNVVVLEFPEAGDPNSKEGMRISSGDPVRWTSVDPRDGSGAELPEDRDVEDLVRRIEALSARAMMVGTRLLADSVRTERDA